MFHQKLKYFKYIDLFFPKIRRVVFRRKTGDFQKY